MKIEKSLKKTSTSVRLQTCDVKRGVEKEEKGRKREIDIERERDK